MKKIGFLLVLLMVVASVTKAQERRGGGGNFDPKERAKQQTERLDEVLDLNKDQETKVYELNLATMEKMGALRKEMQGNGGGFEGMREKMSQIRKENDKKMKEILTDEQWEKYQKYQEENRGRRGQGRRQGGDR